MFRYTNAKNYKQNLTIGQEFLYIQYVADVSQSVTHLIWDTLLLINIREIIKELINLLN